MTGRFLFVALLIVTGASPVVAQGVTVSGTVVDETGARVPGATVTLSGGGTRDSRVTDTAGEYRFPAVTPGDYEISAVSTGFTSGRRGGITVGSTAITVPALSLV